MPRNSHRTGSRPNGRGPRLPRPTLETDDLGLFTTLARTGLFLEALQRECLGAHNLTFSEYSVLRLLQRAESRQRTPSQLAEAVICTTGAMTKLVDRLERHAFVKRRPNPSDRRAVLVELTRAGGHAADEAATTYRTGRERVLARLEEDEALGMHQSLVRLLEVFEMDREDARVGEGVGVGVRKSIGKGVSDTEKRAS